MYNILYRQIIHILTLSILSRIPLPNCGSHSNSPKDQNQAGCRRQEAHFSLWQENSIEERQSLVSMSLRSVHLTAAMLRYDFTGPSVTPHSHFSWYKDGELLEFSHPNYITLKDDHITIVANAINEGTYTCIVKKKDKVLTNYSWRVRVRFWGPRLLICKLNRTHSHTHTQSPGDLTHYGTYRLSSIFLTQLSLCVFMCK